MQKAMKTAVDILAGGTIAAAMDILQRHNLTDDLDLARLEEAMKTTLKANLPAILREWRQAVDANLGEAWLREFLNAQCYEQALEVLIAGGFIEGQK